MILKIDPEHPDEEIIDQAVRVLERGGLVVYPTETAYGLGCDALNEKAIDKIFEVKNRAKNQPLSVIVSSQKVIEEIAELNMVAIELIEEFFPGPLVIALPKKPIIPDNLNSKGIAFRISSNPIAWKLASEFGKPIVSSSANLSGDPTPYSIQQVVLSLDENKIDLMLDAGFLPFSQPSTIIDFQMHPPPQIIREGDISTKKILSFLGIPRKQWKDHMKNLQK